MTDAASPNYWQMGQNLALNLANSGAFGSTVQNIVRPTNPPSVTAPAVTAPPAPPVAGQQGVNPGATTQRNEGFAGHMKAHWPKYAAAAAVVLVLFAGAKLARR